MKYIEIDREGLLTWSNTPRELGSARLARLRNVGNTDDLRSSRAEFIAVVNDSYTWLPLPPVLVTMGSSARELMAWANSYLPLRPLSAYCRVITQDDLWILDRWPREGTATWTDVSLLGPIFTEALTWSIESGQRSMTVDLLFGTFSFVLARAAMFGVALDALPALHKRWVSIHGIRGRDAGTRDLAGVWKVIATVLQAQQENLFGLAGSDELTVAVTHLTQRRPIPVGLVERLASIRVDLDARRTAEERLRTFVDIASRIRESSVPNDIQAFVLGLLANSIAPGTFSHLNVLRQADVSSAAIGWYGFIAASDASSRILSLGDGLGWRVYRELTHRDSLTDVTRADVDYVEYDVVRNHESIKESLLRSAGSRVCVEVMPGIYSYMRNESQPAETAAIGTRPPLQEIGISLARALDAYRILARTETSQLKSRSERRKKS